MKYFLLAFDRAQGRLVDDIVEYSDSKEAFAARVAREALARDEGVDLEVVVLGAASREALVNTHSRYFGVLRELSAS
ncbi:MAG: hypothetical protein ACLPQS_03905 [Acidimicrobiales bacterium]